MRLVALLILGGALAGYAFWVYLRLDLRVGPSRALAWVRAATLLTILILLFDVRLPTTGQRGDTSVVLLDASLSMGAGDPGATPWESASARAMELEAEGWSVVPFGADPPSRSSTEASPTEVETVLGPALEAAAESGAREVIVLSDMRLQDPVAIREAMQRLPIEASFESFGSAAANAGISRFDVPDFVQPDDSVVAEIDFHAVGVGDSVSLVVRSGVEEVARVRAASPGAGLLASAEVVIPSPSQGDRARFEVTVEANGDAWSEDDDFVARPAIGRAEGAVVVVSFRPDWEVRFLIPVLGEATGLPVQSFLQVGGDRFVMGGIAAERSIPTDSVALRRAVDDATLVVLHGVSGEDQGLRDRLVERAGTKLILAADAEGARAAGVEVANTIPGEWYVSADVPSSPIAGSLVGVPLQGLPPLTDVHVVDGDPIISPLHVQLRGAGAPEPLLALEELEAGRVGTTLASGYWRWAVRAEGREAYRRFWSGVAGWLLAGQSAASAIARPTRFVLPRGEPVTWSIPSDTIDVRLTATGAEGVVLDTTVAAGGLRSTTALPPGEYGYAATTERGDTVGAGSFDVLAATEELRVPPSVPEQPSAEEIPEASAASLGQPLRTTPWPYLLILVLLCAEWITRRRVGLR